MGGSKVYSGLAADTVYGIISLILPARGLSEIAVLNSGQVSSTIRDLIHSAQSDFPTGEVIDSGFYLQFSTLKSVADDC